MMISGIGTSSISSIYNYQNSINQLRISQAISKNPEYESLFNKVDSWSQKSSKNSAHRSSSLSFLQDYSAKMGDVMQAANTLKDSNSAGVGKSLSALNSDDTVAGISKNYTLRQKDSFTLNVFQLAAGQKNVSNGVKTMDAAKDDMKFSISSRNGSFDFSINAKKTDGTSKSNLAMLQEAASAINKSGVGLTASVTQTKEGLASLDVTDKETGTGATFEVSGQLGAAEGLQNVNREAVDARYSVTKNGVTTDYTFKSNDVELNYGQLQATLKGIGETEVTVASDPDKMVSAVSGLVDSYNKAAGFLESNTLHGSGVSRQLHSFERSVASDYVMDRLGISVSESGRLVFNEETLKTSLTEEPELTRELISGSHGLAETLYDRAASAMNANSASLINNDLQEMDNSFISNPYEYMNLYNRSGAYTMNNYSAVGLMMDYLA